jgi:hypothetical protein
VPTRLKEFKMSRLAHRTSHRLKKNRNQNNRRLSSWL